MGVRAVSSICPVYFRRYVLSTTSAYRHLHDSGNPGHGDVAFLRTR